MIHAPTGTALIAHPGAELYGSDRVMLETVAALRDHGWRVVLATPTDGPLLAAARALGADTLVLEVPVLRKTLLKPHRLAAFAAQAVRGARAIDGLLRRVRPDVLYVSTLTIPLWAPRARSMGIPALVHVHESERGANMLLRRAIAAPLHAADRVLVNSRHSLRSLLEAAPRLATRSAVIYNGVAGPESVVPPRPELRGGLRVVYVGRLSPRKGVDVALAAVAKLRAQGVPARLDVVGGVFGGYEWYERELREKVAALGLEQDVSFHGFRPSVWPVLANSDVAVVPSRLEEPFGNTAVEALLAGRAVVVSDVGGLGEAVDGFPTALKVRPDDAEALAAALADVASRWNRLRPLMPGVAASAAARYAPETYRTAVARELEALVRRRSPHLATEPGKEPIVR